MNEKREHVCAIRLKQEMERHNVLHCRILCKNKAQIDRIIKKCEEILMEYDESEESENAQDNSNSSKENKKYLKRGC